MLLEGAFFIQSISNFMKRPDFLFATKFSFSCLPPLGGNGGVKNKMLNNGSVLTEKNMLYKYIK